MRENLGDHGVVRENLGGLGVMRENLGGHGVVRENLVSEIGDRGIMRENLGGHGVMSENLGDLGVVRENLGGHGVVRENLGGHGVVRENPVSTDSERGDMSVSREKSVSRLSCCRQVSDKCLFSTVGVLIAAVVVVVVLTIFITREHVDLGHRFLIFTSKCRLTDIDPYHESIRKYLRPAEPIVCSNLPPLTFTSRRQDGRQVLHVATAHVGHYTLLADTVACCYAVIERVNDVDFSVSKCIHFEKEAILEPTTEFVLVKCNDALLNRPVYANMHAVVQKHRDAAASLTTTNITSKRSNERDLDARTNESIKNLTFKVPDRPSVLLLGIDSMSRINLHRTMPLTVKYLQENNWIDFVGFNKVGINTPPNLVAAFTGLDQRLSYALRCWPPQSGHVLDTCPFIWRDFKQRGYTTSYAEDTSQASSSFKFSEASGFNEKPFDFYLRPFMVAAEKLLPNQIRDENPVCLGPTPTMDYVVNYTLDVVKTHLDQPVFVLNWLNCFSHNNHITPSAVDGKFVRFLEDLSAVGDKPFNDAIVVFFSDHGLIFGDLSKTLVGWYEARLPLLYVWVPEWFKLGYPLAYQSLKDNAARLVSPYDLYLTLRDIVDGAIGQRGGGCAACKSCTSLFYPVVADRGCDDAGIREEWCTCKPQSSTSAEGELAKHAPGLVMDHINQRLAEKNLTNTSCAVLKVNSVLSARVKDNAEPVSYTDYVLVLDTQPGRMTYDVTVRQFLANKTSSTHFQLLGEPNRIDSYTNTSQCMKLKEFKPYCYCL